MARLPEPRATFALICSVDFVPKVALLANEAVGTALGASLAAWEYVFAVFTSFAPGVFVHSGTTTYALDVGGSLALVGKKRVIADLHRYCARKVFDLFGCWPASATTWDQLVAFEAFVAVQGVDIVVTPASAFPVGFPAQFGPAFGACSL